MKFWIAACVALLLVNGAVAAQSVPRIKAKILSVDGDTLVLDADADAVKAAPADAADVPQAPVAGSKNSGPSGRSGRSPQAQPAFKDGKLSLSLMPATLVVVERGSVRDAIKVGDFVSAAVSSAPGALHAQSVVIYPDLLRGSNEGRLKEGEFLRLSGRVAAITPAGLTLHYRGKGDEGGVCAGRAVPRALGGQACTGDAALILDASTQISVLTTGNRSLLKAGAIVTVSVMTLGAGHLATPGVIVQQPAP